jgi:succinate dehydrogenase / fumarate reductase, iron-sulfur subunit
MEDRGMRRPAGKSARTVTLVVRTYVPETRDFSTARHEVVADRFTSVLDALVMVKERTDHTLAMRYSCNMGICGSCGMVINGKPRLACETNLFSLGTDEVRVSPLEGHPLLKGLVTDYDEFFARHKSLKPWIIRQDPEETWTPGPEYRQTQRDVDQFLNFAHCIECGLCVDACPVSNTNVAFVGPQALSQAWRYNQDSRDQGERERLEAMDTMEGVWSCEYAGACSEVCPKGVDPALSIQLLKLSLMKRRLTGKTNQERRDRKARA